MYSLEWIGAACTVLIASGFLLVRRWPSVLLMINTVIAVAGGLFASQLGRSAYATEALALTLGLGLLAFGLTVVRVMLRRSVSLYLLSSQASGQGRGDAEERIADRIGELERYKLAVRDGAQLTLTPAGRLVAAVVRVLLRAPRGGQ